MLTATQLYLLLPAVFAGLVGASVQFAYKAPDEVAHSTAQRLVSAVAGWLLTCLLAAITLLKWEWHFLNTAVFALILGLIAERGIMKFLDYMRKAKDFPDMVKRGKKAYEAFQNDPDQPTDTPN